MSIGKEPFIALYGGVYEHSPWITEIAYDNDPGREYESAAELSRTLTAIVEDAPQQKRLDLLRAHPDLAGKLAVGGNLTAESTTEQAGAGLDHCTPHEFDRFQSLNDAYKDKFGFPFIVAVAGYGRREILELFDRRVKNDTKTEMREALDQVHRIALLRLTTLFENGANE